MLSIYTAHLNELPILTEKGKYHFLNEIIADSQFMQVAWLKVSNLNKCIALYGKSPIEILDEGANKNIIIGAKL